MCIKSLIMNDHSTKCIKKIEIRQIQVVKKKIKQDKFPKKSWIIKNRTELQNSKEINKMMTAKINKKR